MSMNRKNLGPEPGDAPAYWRSLEELEQTTEFREMLQREFPDAASEWDEVDGGDTSRRSFLKVMAASLALAGVGTGCKWQPEEKIVPYVKAPEEIIPGKPMYFATAVTLGGYGRGALVESHMGRPTKLEGNPEHPASLGATDVWMQASVLTMYDPDRSKAVTRTGNLSDWGSFLNAITPVMRRHAAAGGRGLRILTETITSPTLIAQLQALLRNYPQARWHHYSPVGNENAAAATTAAFGEPLTCVYRFREARSIVALDADFLLGDPGSVRYSRDFIDGRRVRDNNGQMNRLFVAESTPTITGAMADHRLRIKPSQIPQVAQALAAAVGVAGVTAPQLPADLQQWVALAAADLRNAGGSALVLAGETQPAGVHVLAHAMNAALGAAGRTVVYIPSPAAQPTDPNQSLQALVADMQAGQVETLMMLGGNPVYTAPADLKFKEALDKVPLRIHHSLYLDETGYQCHWHLPMAHELETWSDCRAYDGTVSIQQPLIAPIYQGRSMIEVVSILIGQMRDGYDILRDHWRGQGNAADFEANWQKWLHDGVVANSAAAPRNVTIRRDALQRVDFSAASPATQPAGGGQTVEVVLRPDPTIYDGSWANNAWLQELPKPLTKLTWDNTAQMSPATAARLGVRNSGSTAPVVEITVEGRTVRAPAWVVPGHPDDVVTIHLGYGRQRVGRVGNNVGFSAYALMGANLRHSGVAQIARTGDSMPIACTQQHQLMEGRDLIRVKTPSGAPAGGSGGTGTHGEPEMLGSPESKGHGANGHANGTHKKVPLSLYKEWDYEHQLKWGMMIDQNACIGCNACVVACTSENNVPVVGKEQVINGREMLWLRIDTYYRGEAEQAADVEGPYFQPLPCMHCEKAPCEVVCPVNATVHDAEGLNEMIYNRCIGTRYCSNNCPYKVRRFNFLHFTGAETYSESTSSRALQRNPDVTVRSRGVMEKCTYCVQRLNQGRIEAKKLQAAAVDAPNDAVRQALLQRAQQAIDTIQTACQQACPTQAIVFGDLNNEKAPVTQLMHQPETYALLEELQTQPRTQYLPRYTNPAAGAGHPSTAPANPGAAADGPIDVLVRALDAFQEGAAR